MISRNEEGLRMYLQSQMCFVGLSAIPGAFLTLIVTLTPFGLLWLIYVALGSYLFFQWLSIIRRRSYHRLREGIGILSIIFWVPPLLFLTVTDVFCFFAFFQDEPSRINDVEMPVFEIGLGVTVVAMWFFCPALFAVLAYWQSKPFDCLPRRTALDAAAELASRQIRGPQ